MKKLLGIVVLGLLLSGSAYAMTQNQMMIINQVLNAENGKITKKMHTDFWKDIPNKEDFIEYLETTGLMAKITRDGMQYQMELWKSALISYQNQQVFKSDDYLEIKEVLNDFINRVSKNIPDANQRAQVVKQMKTSMINSDNLLKSAAARTAMQSVQGPIIELSEERITFIINNIEKSFSRIDILLKPVWNEVKIEEDVSWMICKPNREYWGVDRKPLYIKFHKTINVNFDFDKMSWVKSKYINEATPTIEMHEDRSKFTDVVFGYKKILPIYVSDQYYVFYKEINDGWFWGSEPLKISAQHIIINRTDLTLLEYNNEWVKNLGRKKEYNDSVIDELFKEIDNYPKDMFFNIRDENTTETYPKVNGGTYKGKRKLFTFECREIDSTKQKI